MNHTVSRDRLIFMAAVVLLVVERLVIAGLALSNYSQPAFNWTSVILPITHVAVVLFLVYTSDVLIYWLVIMWGVITTGHFSWLFLGAWRVNVAKDRPVELSRLIVHNWPLVVLILFHLILTLIFLTPAIRTYLAEQRRKQDFEDFPPVPSPTDEETKKD